MHDEEFSFNMKRPVIREEKTSQSSWKKMTSAHSESEE